MSVDAPAREVKPADAQARAADPRLSAFVTANAGSGKTKTLIDRVARLLLAGAEPETILCVTYTKAAAAEMQRRLYDLLGGWSVAGDDRLREELATLEGRRPGAYDDRRLSEARALFARALETPGGLKIQTIHAFCEKLLRRFPIEAGISPGFRVMDDAASAAVAAVARRDVALYALSHEDATSEAYARFSVQLDFMSFEAMFTDFETRRGALRAFLEQGWDAAEAWVWAACQLPAGHTPDVVAEEEMRRLDRALWREAADALNAGSATDQKCARQMAAVAADAEATLFDALAALFTKGGEGDAAKWVGKTAALKPREALRVQLLAEQTRLEQARDRVRAAQVAADTLNALRLAAAYLAAYRLEKERAGALDFTDLIERTRHLLRSAPAAAWVLYKLDGGIDHILVDEAQDTAPDQWRIVRALTEEFFSGDGADPDAARGRDLFVVGDEKQSIYSFQGAQPEQLDHEFRFHRDRATGAGYQLERVDLLTSYRSTPQVLSFVDAVFRPPGLAAAIQPREDFKAVSHSAHRADHPGCVDVWPLEREVKGEEREAWTAPLDLESEQSANRRLAKKIACEIKATVDRGDRVWDGRAWRAARWSDVLILVRRRRALFEEILRALKREGIPVAGADRLALSEHIVFDDLLALARFALFPEDDLNLAALLKSPFCGLDDDALFDLARGRKPQSLWARVQAGAPQAAAFLARVRDLAASARPFEFYVRLLDVTGGDGRSMRQRILTRLGAEAQDALEEFLAQVLAAEGRGVHDLERLAFDFASLSITVKREMEAVRDEVRVMTAHGAKGLEAPIVFLPETTIARSQRASPLMETEEIPGLGPGFLWCASKDGDCPASAAARARRQEREEAEAYRLLYVGLTRARDRLVLCGRVAADAKEENIKGWWGAVNDALADAALAPHVRETDCGGMVIRRFGPDPIRVPKATQNEAAAAALPAWARAAAPADPLGRFASPSDLGDGGVVAAPSPLARAGGLGRFRRGDLIHRLLQLLPDLPADARAAGAAALLGRERDLTSDQRAEMIAAALSVLEDARFAEVFGPGSRAEVAIAGSASALPAGLKVSGRIDRLVVLADRVLVADFKTNRPSPSRIEEADPAYLRQMAIYWAVLSDIFPDRRVEAALVWTDGPKLMPIPENLIRLGLAGLTPAG